MMSEEDKQRFEEAKTCKDCLGWHKHCNAECCKTIFIDMPLTTWKDARKHILARLDQPLSLDDMRYYKFRDVEYLRQSLRFRKDRVSIIKGRMIYFYPCKMLEGNLCKVHGEHKPSFCSLLTIETAKDEKIEGNRSIVVTDNCLFKYKKLEVENHGERQI